jgi:hypothetical protein
MLCIHLAELHYKLSFDNEVSRCTLSDLEPELGDPGIQCLVGFHLPSPSGLSRRTYSRSPPSTSSSDALLGCLGLSAGGDIGLRRAETPLSLVS